MRKKKSDSLLTCPAASSTKETLFYWPTETMLFLKSVSVPCNLQREQMQIHTTIILHVQRYTHTILGVDDI